MNVTTNALRVPRKPPRSPELDVQSKVEANERGLFDVAVGGHRIPDAVFHVFSVRLDGELEFQIKNTGRLPLVRTKLQDHQTSIEGVTLYDNTRSLGVIRRGQTFKVSQGWSVTGPFDVLWNLVQLLFTGSVRAVHQFTIDALGFNADVQINALTPVDSVTVAWD